MALTKSKFYRFVFFDCDVTSGYDTGFLSRNPPPPNTVRRVEPRDGI